MTTLISTGAAQAILAWLLTYALHSTVLLAATWLALRSRRFAPAVADVAWKAALLGGLFTATLQGVASRRPAGSIFLGADAASQLTADASTASPAGVSASTGSATQGAATGTNAAIRTNLPTVDPAASPAVAPAAPTTASPATGSTTVVALAWLVIALALVTWYVGRRLILVGRLGDRRPVVDGDVLATLEELRRDTRARSTLRLTASSAISSPVALGGEICLPAAAIDELEPSQLRAMLAHELAHLERRDPQWLAFACVMERAFFFQPLNRLARRGLQENAEYCADEWAAQHSGGVQLAKALVKVAEWIQASPLSVPVAGFAEERSQLTVRVTRLLDGVAGAPRSRAAAVTFAAAVLLVTAAFAPGVSGGTAPFVSNEMAAEPDGATEDARLADAARDGEVLLPDGSAPRRGAPTAAPEGDTQTDPRDLVDAHAALGADGTGLFADTAIVRAVMQRLKDESAEVRRAAADALGRMRHPMSIDVLVIALDDIDGDVRRSAIHALGNFEHARVPAPPIRRMLDNQDSEIRSHAVRILAELRDRAAVPAITRLLEDPEDEVRSSALQALNELEAPIAEEVLARTLADKSVDVRESAAHLAGERQVVAVVPQLIRMLEDRSSGVRESAAHALTEMRTPASHAALRTALTHRDANVRRIAVEYFGEEVDK